MIIYDITEKGKNWPIRALDRLFLPLFITIVGFGSYGIYVLIHIEAHKPQVTIDYPPTTSSQAQQMKESTVQSKESVIPGKYVAARGGKNYYDPWCPQVKRIADKNKVWFPSQEIAELAGYKAVPHCKSKKATNNNSP